MDVVQQVTALIAPTAAKFETVPEHWIHGWDESLSFCFECAEKKGAELLAQEPDEDYLIAGGYRLAGDSQAFCETCTRALGNSFTEYAAESELDHFEEYGFDVNSPDDCYALLEVINTTGCSNDELNKRIETLCAKVVAGSVSPERTEDSNEMR